MVGALFILSPIGTSVVEHLPLSAYQINRIITSVDPFYDRYGAGFQVSNSLIAFTRGGLVGSGLGTSIQKVLLGGKDIQNLLYKHLHTK